MEKVRGMKGLVMDGRTLFQVDLKRLIILKRDGCLMLVVRWLKVKAGVQVPTYPESDQMRLPGYMTQCIFIYTVLHDILSSIILPSGLSYIHHHSYYYSCKSSSDIKSFKSVYYKV